MLRKDGIPGIPAELSGNLPSKGAAARLTQYQWVHRIITVKAVRSFVVYQLRLRHSGEGRNPWSAATIGVFGRRLPPVRRLMFPVSRGRELMRCPFVQRPNLGWQNAGCLVTFVKLSIQ
jgi:hypothetical protein